MKKVMILISLGFILFSSCSKQELARSYGGTITVNLPAGQELMEVTWKNENLFYLTRPMTKDYVPVTKTFQEQSGWGILESTVIFIESR